MTFLALTTTADRRRLVISADSQASLLNRSARRTEAAWSADYDAQLESTYLPPGKRGPRRLFALGRFRKVVRCGDVLLAGIGDMITVARWFGLLRVAVDLSTARGFARLYPNVFPRSRPAHLIVAGVEGGAVAAYAYTAPDWTGRLIAPGHVLHPPPDPLDDEYANILERWEPAVFDGIDILGFHQAVYENARRALKARRFRTPNGFGGSFRRKYLLHLRG